MDHTNVNMDINKYLELITVSKESVSKDNIILLKTYNEKILDQIQSEMKLNIITRSNQKYFNKFNTSLDSAFSNDLENLWVFYNEYLGLCAKIFMVYYIEQILGYELIAVFENVNGRRIDTIFKTEYYLGVVNIYHTFNNVTINRITEQENGFKKLESLVESFYCIPDNVKFISINPFVNKKNTELEQEIICEDNMYLIFGFNNLEKCFVDDNTCFNTEENAIITQNAFNTLIQKIDSNDLSIFDRFDHIYFDEISYQNSIDYFWENVSKKTIQKFESLRKDGKLLIFKRPTDKKTVDYYKQIYNEIFSNRDGHTKKFENNRYAYVFGLDHCFTIIDSDKYNTFYRKCLKEGEYFVSHYHFE